jgi:serine/threonine-protein kinase
VSIYDFGEDGAMSYIAMEYVKGRELKECFDANERFRIADTVRIMGQILGALEYSHAQGVIHRDIKPANIFLLPDGTVKVADFGIAHIESSNLTQVGTVLGTPSYMSPEQIMGLPVDGRSDLFSAGVILYQFLTGERPFAGSATTTMQKVLKEDPLPPSTLNVQVLPAMDAVVRKALAKRADDRFQSAQEFAEAIRVSAASMAGPSPSAVASAEATVIAGAEATVLAAPAATSIAATPQAGQSSPVTKPRNPALAIVIGVAVIAVGAALWFILLQKGTDVQRTVQAPSSSTASAPVSAAGGATSSTSAPTTTVAASATTPVVPVPAAEPGTLVISAVGLADPSDPRYQNDKALLQSDLRADSRGQTVAKALGLLLDSGSLSKNYDVLRDRLLSQSGSYIKTVVRESPPREGKDGLVSLTTDAVVNVKAVQKALNQMSRSERIELIRASGDPRISVQIAVRDADRPDVPPLPSPIAENLVKERIKTFGFRTWSEGGAPGGDKGPDFAVLGEAKVKRLTARLEASGVVITKFTLTSWTVKCIDRETGEEIYYNTTLPKGVGSWASEEEALKTIGTKIADEFSRDFFLQHANVAGRKITLVIEGLPDAAWADALGRELIGLSAVIAAAPRSTGGSQAFDLQLAGGGAPGDLVASRVLQPLNAKLGGACFVLGGTTENQVTIVLDKPCANAATLARLETNPPAGLYGAPLSRQKSVVRNPETLRKLTI